VCPGDVFVIQLLVAEAAVEDAHEAIAKGAQGLVVGVVGTPVIGTNLDFSRNSV